jgi:eukaryotic-like serine/threonine-protein kinase
MPTTPRTEESIFTEALDKRSPDELVAFLDGACGSDAALRARVENLLRSHEHAGSFLRKPLAATVDQPAREQPGMVIGPYKLMEQIGEGGMGLVFVAEQQQPVRRRVALMIIKPGMDSRQVIARFEAERQALALMDHQNIAKVYDTGTTESGRPYFVMELVHGVPITDYCDANQLTPRQRLELFVPVCQAVQHAHQKGIIHRDLKPSNVLVTMYDDKPVPKVIDFGVAKAVEQRLTEKTVYTQFGTLVGTFEYMSPEQAEMNAFGVDTRSDVYALGVLLYELLTGTTPLERPRLRQAAFDEIRRIIKEEEPPRPSVRLSTSGALAKVAAARKTDPGKLSRLVRGELDWVVMRCLEKDRTRRYDTASALARDVERYLRDEPVEACPPSAGYRLRKLARKYRKPLEAAAAFAILLLAGVVVSSWLAVRATQAEKDTRAERDRALEAEKLASEEKQNAEASLRFLLTDVLEQADPWQQPKSDLTVRALLDQAAARLEANQNMPPLVKASIRRTMGSVYYGLWELMTAEKQLREAYELQKEYAGENNRETLTTAYKLGMLYWIQSDYAQAEPLYVRVVEGRRQLLGEEDRDTLAATNSLANMYKYRDESERALPLLTKALETSRRVYGENDWLTLMLSRSLGSAYVVGGQYAEAEQILVPTLNNSPDKRNPNTLIVESVLATLYYEMGRLDDAERLGLHAYQLRKEVLGELNAHTLYSEALLANIYIAKGQLDKARPLWSDFRKEAHAQQDRLPPFVIWRVGEVGLALLKQQQFAESETFLRFYLDLAGKKHPPGWRRSNAVSALGECLLGQKDFAKAEPLLKEGYEGLLKHQAKTPASFRQSQLTDALQRLVRFYEGAGTPDEAARWRKELEKAKDAGKKP